MKTQDVATELLRVQQELDATKEELEKITKERDEANAVIATDIKARKITDLVNKSNYTVEDLDSWTLEELDGALKHVNMAKARSIKPIADMGTASAKSPQAEMDTIYAPWLKK